MKIKFFIQAVIISFLLCCCSNKKAKISFSKLKLNIVDSLIIPIETSSICCSDSLFYCIEKYGNSIFCYDYKGRKKFSFGSQGLGPGEFTNIPSNVTLWNDYIVAADIPNFELELFDIKGNYLKTISYIKEMISPIFNIVPLHNRLIIEGLSLRMENEQELIFKNITIDKDFNIKTIYSKVLKKLTSFNDIFKDNDPFLMGNTYFLIGNSAARVISNELIRIYNKSDSVDISLKHIPLVKCTQEVKGYLKNTYDTKSISEKGLEITYSLPDVLPKVKSIFQLDGKLIVLSQFQDITNKINDLENNIYIYDSKKRLFERLTLPSKIPVSKIMTICDNNIFIKGNEEIEIFKCNLRDKILEDSS